MEKNFTASYIVNANYSAGSFFIGGNYNLGTSQSFFRIYSIYTTGVSVDTTTFGAVNGVFSASFYCSAGTNVINYIPGLTVYPSNRVFLDDKKNVNVNFTISVGDTLIFNAGFRHFTAPTNAGQASFTINFVYELIN